MCVQSILAYNGAAIIAMTGKDCVAIAADRRFGIQAQTVSMDSVSYTHLTLPTIVGV